MSWGLVATAGGALLGGVLSNRTASKNQDRADERDDAALAFEQQRYDDWNDVYGPLQDNLSNYYTNLSPDQYEVVGLEAIEVEKARTQELLTQEFAQRGISDSGLAVSSQVGLELETMGKRADVRRSAPGAVADEKMRFLQVGLGQNPGDSMSQTLADRAAESRTRADSAARSAASATQTAITTTGTALSDYLNDEGGA